MGYSDLCEDIVEACPSNYTQGRKGYSICKITPHHMAGVLTGAQCARLFQREGRNGSANYCIGNDGDIVGCVDECNRAWTSGSCSNDCQAITIEVSNCATGGDWPISDAAWNSLVNLCVDICRRYGFRLEYTWDSNGSLTRHNMFQATACPGPYLECRFEELAEVVNSRLEEQPQPAEEYYVGDIVTINGIYTTSSSDNKLNPLRTVGEITKIVENARNPYLLDGGNLGWTNRDCIVSVEHVNNNCGCEEEEEEIQPVIEEECIQTIVETIEEEPVIETIEEEPVIETIEEEQCEQFEIGEKEKTIQEISEERKNQEDKVITEEDCQQASFIIRLIEKLIMKLINLFTKKK